MKKFSNNYDLEERTAKFGEDIILLCRQIRKDEINISIVKQLIRSATSIGANYMEANGASSKKDFRNKIYICRKEAQEAKHWLRMLNTTNTEKKDDIKELWKEGQELTLIFFKIASSCNKSTINK